MVSIYTLNASNNLYLTTPELTDNIGNNIYSVWVNPNADKIYVGTGLGCMLLIKNGTNWNVNSPLVISSSLGTNPCKYIR